MLDITKLIGMHGSGSLLEEINSNLESVIRDCCIVEKKGELTIKLTFEPEKTRDGGHQMKISPSVTTKNPRWASGISIVYVVTDAEGNPVDIETDNPAQTKLFENFEKEMKDAR